MRNIQDGAQVNRERYRRHRDSRGRVGVWQTRLLIILVNDSISIKTS